MTLFLRAAGVSRVLIPLVPPAVLMAGLKLDHLWDWSCPGGSSWTPLGVLCEKSARTLAFATSPPIPTLL